MKIEWLFPYAKTRIGEGRQAEAVIVPFPSAHHRFCWHEDAFGGTKHRTGFLVFGHALNRKSSFLCTEHLPK